jgi:hypothetical protein
LAGSNLVSRWAHGALAGSLELADDHSAGGRRTDARGGATWLLTGVPEIRPIGVGTGGEQS